MHDAFRTSYLHTTVPNVLAVRGKLQWLTPGALPLGSGVILTEDVMRLDALLTVVRVRVKCYTH